MARNLRCNLPETEQERIIGYFEDRPFLDDAEESQMSACFTQYLFFEPWGTRDYRECHCTTCGQFSQWRNENPDFFKQKHGDSVNCPNCDTDVKLVALGRMRNLGSLNNEELRFSIFRPAPDGGLLVCSGWGHKYFTWGDLSPAVSFKEKERQYFAPGVRMRWKRAWEYAGLCGTGPATPAGWAPCDFMKEPHNPTMNYTSDGSYFLICAERIWDTKLRYCELENWYHDRCKVWITDTAEPVRYIHRYLAAYTAYPQLEMACRLGFYKAVDDLVLDNYKNAKLLNWSADTSWGFLRLTKIDGRAFLKAEGSMDLLRLYQATRKQIKNLSMHDFLLLSSRIGGETNAAKLYGIVQKARCSVVEAVNYVERQRQRDRISGVLQIWDDYLNFARTLEYDLSRRDVSLPKDLRDRHDAAAATVAMLGVQVNDPRFNKRLKSLNDMYAFDFDGYSIVVPGSAKAIVEEGTTLHHCVGGYAARHMEGQVDILFLRKSRKKGTPYITIEMQHRSSGTSPVRIQQIHGYKNDNFGKRGTGNPKQQYAWFLDVWLDWLAHGSKRDKDGRPILSKRKENTA